MGASIEFTGGTDNVEVSNYSGMTDIFDGGGNVSIWVKLDSSLSGSGSAVRFLDKTAGTSSSPTEGWAYYHQPEDSSNFRVNFFIVRDALQQFNLSLPIPYDEWIHFSLNWIGDGDVGPVQYNNGVNVGSMVPFPGSGAYTPGANPVFFGNSPNLDRPLEAEMCYVHMYDKELSVEEINEIMHKPGSIRDGLVGFWPLTDDGSTQRNLAGIGNTGAVTGATNSADGPPVTCFK